MMQEIISFFKSNSEAIIAVASVITVFATIVIAWSSWISSRILKWDKEKDRRNRQPVLILVDEITDDHRSLYAENIGYGPAMNIVRAILQTGELTQHTPTESLPLRPLGQGQRAYAYCATLPPNNSVPIIDDPDFSVRFEYDDIFENHYETCFKNREHLIAPIPQRKIPFTHVGRI